MNIRVYKLKGIEVQLARIADALDTILIAQGLKSPPKPVKDDGSVGYVSEEDIAAHELKAKYGLAMVDTEEGVE